MFARLCIPGLHSAYMIVFSVVLQDLFHFCSRVLKTWHLKLITQIKISWVKRHKRVHLIGGLAWTTVLVFHTLLDFRSMYSQVKQKLLLYSKIHKGSGVTWEFMQSCIFTLLKYQTCKQHRQLIVITVILLWNSILKRLNWGLGPLWAFTLQLQPQYTLFITFTLSP